MRNCTQCNNSFSFCDRLKTFFNNGYLKCSYCNANYKPKINGYRGIYIGVILIVNIFVFNNITLLNDLGLKLMLQILTIIITFPLFDLLPHRWHRYEKIN